MPIQWFISNIIKWLSPSGARRTENIRTSLPILKSCRIHMPFCLASTIITSVRTGSMGPTIFISTILELSTLTKRMLNIYWTKLVQFTIIQQTGVEKIIVDLNYNGTTKRDMSISPCQGTSLKHFNVFNINHPLFHNTHHIHILHLKFPKKEIVNMQLQLIAHHY